MKQYFAVFCFIACLTAPALAAEPAPLLSDTPLCAYIENQTDRTVFVGVRTNYFIAADGQKNRHEASLRLEPKGYQQICAQGPFYDGYRVELILRTIIPVFDCKTTLDHNLIITSTKTKDDVTKLSLNCE